MSRVFSSAGIGVFLGMGFWKQKISAVCASVHSIAARSFRKPRFCFFSPFSPKKQKRLFYSCFKSNGPFFAAYSDSFLQKKCRSYKGLKPLRKRLSADRILCFQRAIYVVVSKNRRLYLLHCRTAAFRSEVCHGHFKLFQAPGRKVFRLERHPV